MRQLPGQPDVYEQAPSVVGYYEVDLAGNVRRLRGYGGADLGGYPSLVPEVALVCERDRAAADCAAAFTYGGPQDFWVAFKWKSAADRYEMFRVAADLRTVTSFNRDFTRNDIPATCGCRFMAE